MTGHREDAEDLAQAAFVRAYRSIDRFRGQAAFYTWLYRIAVNLALNFLKRRRRAPSLSLNDMDQGVERDPAYLDLVARESPVRDVSLGELQRRINEAMQKLSENHRAVVVMFDVQGMSHDEIAKVLGISEGTVRSRLFYARRQLQKELAEFVQ
jgi:RNA polymerase sigma-70 factor (ECF subfamily)